MNSRSSVNESNLVNFSPDLASLNALDKEPLLSFPFDHLYACHSQSSDCGQSLTLDKNVEISTHCLVQPDKTIQEKDAEILSLKTQNKKLKQLIVYHLDLIQQQNDVITNREKSLTTVQEGTSTVQKPVGKSAVRHQTLAQRHLNPPPLFHVPNTCTATSATTSQVDTASDEPVQKPVGKPAVRHQTLAQRHLNPPPLFHVPNTCTATSATTSQVDTASDEPMLFSTFSEIFGPEPFTGDQPKPFGHDPFDLGRPSEALPELREYMPTHLPSILDSSLTPLNSDFNMIDRVPCLPPVKTAVTTTDTSNRDTNYTITTSSGIPNFPKAKTSKRPSSCLGSLSRMPKTTKPEPSTIYDNEIYNVNKKAKTMSTYGKGKLNSLRYPYAGSLSDRLQLIDTTPTGEDPYQIGEAEMREQSPIPRLVLPKNNRVRIHTGEGFETLNSSSSVPSKRRIYDPEPEPKPKKKKASKVRTNQKKSAAPVTATTNTVKTTTASEHNVIKMEDPWEPFRKKSKPSSLGDFSYGETSANLTAPTVIPSGELVTSGNHLPSATLVSASNMDLFSSCKLEKMDITKMSYNDIFETSGDEDVDIMELPSEPDNSVAVRSTTVTDAVVPMIAELGARTTSLASSSTAGEDASIDSLRGVDSEREGRKRALSPESATKREKAPPKPRAARGRGGYRGKRVESSWIAVPPLTTRKPYHTALGHPDISWYLGHDPDVKKEDVDQLAENTSSNVEVPRWRTMIFTSLASAEGTEKTDDDVYRKRHQKLETEERRQLRWHMRRVREQRHVERLRMRQRNPWTVSTHATPLTYTIWPSPLRDLQLIEITDTLPVLAFGEGVPNLSEIDFVLPWVKTAKAQKRYKRSKTLH